VTRQTAAPLAHATLSATYRRAIDLVRLVERNELDLKPPYQRGQVWNADQQMALIRSWLLGIPTGVVILSDRENRNWAKHNGTTPINLGDPSWACIDGQQRITTAQLWFGGHFGVPATWFDPSYIDAAVMTDDGPYVGHTGLTVTGQRMVDSRALIQVSEAKTCASVADEAAIYLLVNGGGTPQTEADMANAQHIATGPCTVAWHAHPDGQHGAPAATTSPPDEEPRMADLIDGEQYLDRHGDIWELRADGTHLLLVAKFNHGPVANGWYEEAAAVIRDFGPMAPLT